ADQAGVARERGLRNRAKPERLRGEHEVRDISAAIDRAIDAERLVGVDDGHMRRAEEGVVFERLFCVGELVASDDAERIVELKAAFTATLEIDAEIFTRRREVVVVLGTRRSLRIDRLTEAFLGLAACDQDLPGLAVAPGCGALRRSQDMIDGLAIDFL